MKIILTGHYELNLFRHGSSELVKSVTSIFALKVDKVLVGKHNSSTCGVCFVCCDVRRDKVFAIFCPSVSVGAKYIVSIS